MKHHRRRNILVLIIVAGILSVVVLGVSLFASGGVKVGQQAPDFTVQDINSNYFHLYGHSGTPVLLEFMRTTCSHCVNEAPTLASLWTNHQSHIVMVSISVDPSGDSTRVLASFATTYNQPWTWVRDTSGLAGTYGVNGTPTMFLLDKQGVVRYIFQGEVSLQTLENAVQSLL